MRVTVFPSKAYGIIEAPPSKSMAHRLLICAGLGSGKSAVYNIEYSQDIEATVSCLKALGADILTNDSTVFIRGTDVKRPPESVPVLNCSESGSTLRFFAPLCMLSGAEYRLEGTEYLFTRPLSVYESIAERQGTVFEKEPSSLTVRGKLKSGVYNLPGDISSQFISGLMFALPLLDGDSEIRLIPPVESRPYISMTQQALSIAGVTADICGDNIRIQGGQSYKPIAVRVEGDWSNAAFFYALNCAGSDVIVEGLDDDSLQGDRVCKILFEKIKSHEGPLDISDCPDLGPVLFAVAAMYGGGEFIGTRRLKIKESDRAQAMREELMKFGVSVDVEENRVTVGGGLRAPSDVLDGHGDHRIVMALAVLSTITGGVIDGAEAVRKSFPDFFKILKQLGVELEYGMD